MFKPDAKCADCLDSGYLLREGFPPVPCPRGCEPNLPESAIGPKACRYYEIAKRRAAQLMQPAKAFEGRILWEDVETSVVNALLDAYEAGQHEARTGKLGVRGLGNCDRCGVQLTIQDERLERGLCPDCRQQEDEEQKR